MSCNDPDCAACSMMEVVERLREQGATPDAIMELFLQCMDEQFPLLVLHNETVH